MCLKLQAKSSQLKIFNVPYPYMYQKKATAASRHCQPYLLYCLGVAATDNIKLSPFLRNWGISLHFYPKTALVLQCCASHIPSGPQSIPQTAVGNVVRPLWFWRPPRHHRDKKTSLHHVTRSCDCHGTSKKRTGKGEFSTQSKVPCACFSVIPQCYCLLSSISLLRLNKGIILSIFFMHFCHPKQMKPHQKFTHG